MDFLFGVGGGQAISLIAIAAAVDAATATAASSATSVQSAAGQFQSSTVQSSAQVSTTTVPTASIASATSQAQSSSATTYYSSSSATSNLFEAAQANSAAAAAAAALSSHFSGHDNGPILYSDSNRTSAIDDIRSIVIYIFIVSVFSCFFLILPGIRHEKLPTFFCITTSLFVGSIIIVCLMGTAWQVGEAPIFAAYKAFSRDRIQGDLSVRIGLKSVNISLKAHKYYLLHSTDGPMVMENVPAMSMLATMTESVGVSGHLLAADQTISRSTIGASAAAAAAAAVAAESAPSTYNSLLEEEDQTRGQRVNESNFVEYATAASDQSTSGAASSFISDINSNLNDRDVATATATATSETVNNNKHNNKANSDSLADELLVGRTSDGILVDTELDTEEVFSSSDRTAPDNNNNNGRATRSASGQVQQSKSVRRSRRHLEKEEEQGARRRQRRQQQVRFGNESSARITSSAPSIGDNLQQNFQKYTIKRVHVDINYNERFYWIGPVQMRQEYHQALERGLPYPILTVVEYLAQDDAGFNWSRQYRLAGYYTTMAMWLSASVCLLMFCLHCAAPKYGIYAMQLLGCLLLLTNLTYASLVPKGDQKLVIPFEGQSLSFKFGWNFWLVLVGGCLSLFVGTVFVVIDCLMPNFIFTTVLDADFETQRNYHYQRKHKILSKSTLAAESDDQASEESEEDEDDHRSNVHEKPKLPPFMLNRSQIKKRRSSSTATDYRYIESRESPAAASSTSSGKLQTVRL